MHKKAEPFTTGELSQSLIAIDPKLGATTTNPCVIRPATEGRKQKLKKRHVSAKENVYFGASLNPNPKNMVTPRHHTKIWSTNACQYVPSKKIAPQLNNTDAGSTICRVEGRKYFRKERLIEHFEKAKKDPIHLVELDPENTEISLWYHEFLVKKEQ